MRRILWFLLAAPFLLAFPARGGIDLVTLPERDSVQLTIYNSADLTLAREVRKLTLQKGLNKLSFGWANTLIDPTSLSLRAVEHPDQVELLDVSYPPGVNSEAVWTVRSEIEGEVLVEILFFTSGINWRAFYQATLAPDEKDMFLEGFVRVTNGSGEDYDNAQTRLIVGRIHLLDQIAELAQRSEPFGRPGMAVPVPPAPAVFAERRMAKAQMMDMACEMVAGAAVAPKEIIKEGLSEYFLYTIEGTESIPNGWSKRLPSFKPVRVPVVNLYKYDDRRFGEGVVRRLLYFKNDKDHHLGETPLPDGQVEVFRALDAEQHLSFEGSQYVKYIPVEQEAEVDLGSTEQVQVEPKLMKMATHRYTFNSDKNVTGWDEGEDWAIEVKNFRDLPVRVEITRHMKHPHADPVKPAGDCGQFEKKDAQTLRFTLDLQPHETKTFKYTITYHEGKRRDQR